MTSGGSAADDAGLAAVPTRREGGAGRRAGRGEIAAAEKKLKRPDRMVEEGVTDLDDILKERLSAKISPDIMEPFGRLMREKVTGSAIPFRKAWLQTIVGRVEVGLTSSTS